jgi:hypothetical protein
MPEPDPEKKPSDEDKTDVKRPSQAIPPDDADDDDGYGDPSPDPIVTPGP